jgi:hypothetical protein
VAEDGYGVSYQFANEEVLFFHVSRCAASLSLARLLARSLSLSEDGYGVSYQFANEVVLFFHVSRRAASLSLSTLYPLSFSL